MIAGSPAVPLCAEGRSASQMPIDHRTLRLSTEARWRDRRRASQLGTSTATGRRGTRVRSAPDSDARDGRVIAIVAKQQSHAR